MTKRISLLLMACQLLLSVGEVEGQVRVYTSTDEINNVHEYRAIILSTNYKSYTHEEHIRVICRPNGGLSIAFMSGRRYDAFSQGYSDLHLKFDNEPLYTIVPIKDFAETDNKTMMKQGYASTARGKANKRSLVRKLIAHNLLLVKTAGITATTRYSLAGSAKAFAPIVS